jgi:hypothetical protein
VLLLSSSHISSALLNEADQARASGLMTYNFAGRQSEHLVRWPGLRLIMGMSKEDERSIRSSSRLQAFANISRHAQVRVLSSSHVKLAIFWTGTRRGRVRAILSTMNGTAAHDFLELGIIVTGSQAVQLEQYFEQQWLLATPVNPLDLASIKQVFEAGGFEGPSAP